MRDGNAVERGRRKRRRHAGNHLDGNSSGNQREGLLAASAEDERVAALEPHDALAAERAADHHPLDGLLRDGVPPGAFAHVAPARLRSVTQRRAVDQRVVEDHVGGAQPRDGAERKELRIAGAGAHQRYETRSAHAALRVIESSTPRAGRPAR